MDIEVLISDILQKLAEPSVRPISEIHVSDIANCLRRSYYSRKQPKKVDLVSAMRMKFGTTLHEYIQNELLKYGFSKEVRVVTDCKDFRIIATPDLIHEEKGIVVELKTTNSNLITPHENYVKQLKMYMRLLSDHITVTKGYIVVINRDSGYVRAFEVNEMFDFDYIYNRAKKLYECLINDTPPEPEYSNLCTWCPYRKECLEQLTCLTLDSFCNGD